MNGGRDLDALGRGIDNARAGRLVYDGLPTFADSVERALAVAGFELQRRTPFPVLIHAGRRKFWLVGDDGRPGTLRPLYWASGPDGLPPPNDRRGYTDLRALFGLKGEYKGR